MSVALVTGGTRGIGLAIVRALKEAGHTVAVVGRSNIIDSDIDLYIQQDLLIGEDVEYISKHIINKVVSAFGSIDILVNNAGMQISNSALAYTQDEWNKSIRLLLTIPFTLSQQAARYMLQKKHGRIINISSVAGILGTRGIIGYSVAKAGLIEMTKCLSNEWLSDGITVNALAPGFIDTDMQTLEGDHKQAMLGRIPAGRMGTPEEVAVAVKWLASDEARYISGVCLPIDGGWLAR